MHVIGAPVGLGTTDLGQWKFIKKGFKAAGRGIKKVGTTVAKGAKVAFRFATKPIRSRINTLISRRARKLAWDRRKSTVPNEIEKKEAKAWTKRTLKAKGPHGQLLAMFAGASDTDVTLLGDSLGQGWEEAVMASLPALIALTNSIVKAAGKSGEAPADPTKAPGPVSPETAEVPTDITISPTPETAAFVEEASERFKLFEEAAKQAEGAADVAAEAVAGYFGQARHSPFEPIPPTPGTRMSTGAILLLAGLGIAAGTGAVLAARR